MNDTPTLPVTPTPPVLEFDTSMLTEAELAAITKPLDEPDFYEPGTEPTEEQIKLMQTGLAPQAPQIDPADARAAAADDAAAAAAVAAAAAAPATPAAPAAPADPNAVAEELPPTIPPAPDLATELAAIEADAAALKAKLDDGEISDADFAAGNRALGARQGRAEAAKEAYDRDFSAARAKADDLWNAAGARLAATDAGKELLNPDNLAKFNEIVFDITEKTTGKTYDQMLAMARNVFAARYDRPDLAATAAAKPAAAPATPAPPATTTEPARIQPVPTLAKMPAVQEEGADQNRWAEVDRLLDRGDTAGYQRAIAAMSEQERADFGKYAG